MTARRPALAAILPAYAALLCACATPLGPGHTINKQQYEVQWIAVNQLLVRGSYRVQNTGDRPLDYIEVTLPPESRRRDLKLVLDGVAVAPEPPARLSPAGTVRIPLRPAWPRKKKGDLVIEYLFAADGSAGTPSFYLKAGGWYPELQAHQGLFGAGGDPPETWDLRITVPRDFLVHASGEPKGQKRRDESVVHRFRQRRAEHLYPFVLAGRFQQHSLRSNVLRASLWSAGELDESAARAIVQRIAQAIGVLESRFGPRSLGAESLLFVNGPASAGSAEPDAVTFPDAAWTDPGLFTGSVADRKAAFCVADKIVARLWFHHLARPDPDAQALAAAFTAYAAGLVPGGCDLAAEHDFVARAIRRYDEAHAALGTSADQREGGDDNARHQLQESKATLFVAALESRLGRDVLNASLKRMLQSLRGRIWTTNDLRVAIHVETGHDPQEFFRQWLNLSVIPASFRTKHEKTATDH
ncbi:MAG: hypothetical protein ACRD5G_07560 [Candidatus Acidiferrales bacterium]